MDSPNLLLYFTTIQCSKKSSIFIHGLKSAILAILFLESYKFLECLECISINGLYFDHLYLDPNSVCLLI